MMSTHETTTSKQFQLDVAHCCGHPVHPGISQGIPNLCPFCQVQDFLKALVKHTNQWKVYGGPYPQNAKTYHGYKSCRKVWQTHKLELVKYMYTLELWTEEEAAWTAEHPEVVQALGEEWSDVQTSEAALAVARMGLPFADTLETDLVPNSSSTHEKSVRFADDIVERL